MLTLARLRSRARVLPKAGRQVEATEAGVLVAGAGFELRPVGLEEMGGEVGDGQLGFGGGLFCDGRVRQNLDSPFAGRLRGPGLAVPANGEPPLADRPRAS